MKTSVVVLGLVFMIMFFSGIGFMQPPYEVETTWAESDRPPDTCPKGIRANLQLAHFWPISSVTFSRDGRYALTIDDWKHELKLWDIRNSRQIFTYLHGYSLNCVVMSPDGKRALIGDDDGNTALVDVARGDDLYRVSIKTPRVGAQTTKFSALPRISPFAFSPDGQFCLLSVNETLLVNWNVKQARPVKFLSGHGIRVTRAVFSSDGKKAASVDSGGTAMLWDLANGASLNSLGGLDELEKIFSADDRRIVANEPQVRRDKWTVPQQDGGSSPDETIIGFSADGNKVLTGFRQAPPREKTTLKLWDVPSRKIIREVDMECPHLYLDITKTAALSPDGATALVACFGVTKKINLLDGREEDRLAQSQATPANTDELSLSPDGRYAFITIREGFHLWDIQAGRISESFKKNMPPSSCWDTRRAFSAGNMSVIEVAKHEIKAVDLKSGQTKWSIPTESGENDFYSVSLTPDGRRLVTQECMEERCSIKYWDADRGVAIKAHHNMVRNYFWGLDPSARTLLITPRMRYGNGLSILDLDSGREIKKFSGRSILSATFTTDGVYVGATVDFGKEMCIFNVKNGRKIRNISLPDTEAPRIAFSNNAKYILYSQSNICTAGLNDPTIRVMNLATERVVAKFGKHEDGIANARFLPDDRRVISLSIYGTLRLWEAATGREIALFVVTQNGEWVVITPDGYYNASPNGHRFVQLIGDGSPDDIEKYRPLFFRPDLVTRILSGAGPTIPR